MKLMSLKEGVALSAIVLVLFGGFWMAIGPAKRCDLRQDWDGAVHAFMGRGAFARPVNMSLDCLMARQLGKDGAWARWRNEAPSRSAAP